MSSRVPSRPEIKPFVFNALTGKCLKMRTNVDVCRHLRTFLWARSRLCRFQPVIQAFRRNPLTFQSLEAHIMLTPNWKVGH